MADLLVNLLKLPPFAPAVEKMASAGILVRRANSFEQTPIRQFVEKHFAIGWADEISVAYGRQPVTLFVAAKATKILGFAAYECTRRGFLGPMGVARTAREKGIGTALLLSAMHGMYEMGYVYGIIGGVGPVKFYQKTVGAIEIPGSTPGIYTDILKAGGRSNE
ncbi:MAG TPA: GNAT family N-acetyltransferase [Tepidisphaeraceae bacterium]|nr:GNAT family N-acetyltransferase [Tepidisphaeraceae bacterium]